MIIPLKERDRFNTLRPDGDESGGLVVPSTLDPQQAKVVAAQAKVAAPAAPRKDLAEIYLTGLTTRGDGPIRQDLNSHLLNRDVSRIAKAEELRLNMSTPVAAAPDKYGLLKGDPQGYPNGRRLIDDVVTVNLRMLLGEPAGRGAPGLIAEDQPGLPHPAPLRRLPLPGTARHRHLTTASPPPRAGHHEDIRSDESRPETAPPAGCVLLGGLLLGLFAPGGLLRPDGRRRSRAGGRRTIWPDRSRPPRKPAPSPRRRGRLGGPRPLQPGAGPPHRPTSPTTARPSGAFERSLRLPTADGAPHIDAVIGMGALANARHDFTTALRWGERAARPPPTAGRCTACSPTPTSNSATTGEAESMLRRMLEGRPDFASFTRAARLEQLFGRIEPAHRLLLRALDIAGDPAEYAFCLWQLGELAWHTGDVLQRAGRLPAGAGRRSWARPLPRGQGPRRSRARPYRRGAARLRRRRRPRAVVRRRVRRAARPSRQADGGRAAVRRLHRPASAAGRRRRR